MNIRELKTIMVKDIVKNFKDITGFSIKDIFDDEGLKIEIIEETLPIIKSYLISKYDYEMDDDMLYMLDEELYSNSSNTI